MFKPQNLFRICCLLILLLAGSSTFAQDADLEFALDAASETTPLPKIFKPNIDLSGRGFNKEISWPQGLAGGEVLDIWQKDIGFNGVYRLQYSLWEISELAKDKDLQDSLLRKYDDILKKITEAGGIVILDIFGTPAGLGKVLDKKSAPVDLKVFKELVKNHIRNLSCNKRYNIWYEVWSAPDLDDFFLGRKQEYLNLYRAVAEAIKELEDETKVYIPLGGPASSWWFQNLDGNTIITPEKSLIYELIRLCSRYHLPLDFITWHTYSTDPKIEKELTIYHNKTAIALIRDWLSYFNFDRNTPLIVDEWNYDREANVLPERSERSFVCASYIPSRIKNMYEAGLDYQTYFSLEDFQKNKEGINRNVGIFWFDPDASEYRGGPKAIYNVFRMMTKLGNEMFLSSLKFNDEFVGIVATKAQDTLAILIYNYIDPEIAKNYLSRNIASLNDKERKVLLSLIKSYRLEKIYNKELDISKLRASNKLKNLLKKAQELNEQAKRFKDAARNMKIGIKNLKENYLYQRYTIDSSCTTSCEFVSVEEKEVNITDSYQEVLSLSPYSINAIILKKKPPEPEIPVPGPEVTETTPESQSQTQVETKEEVK
jgi:hypothetical protein